MFVLPFGFSSELVEYPHQARKCSTPSKCFYQPTKKTSLLVFFPFAFFFLFYCKYIHVAEPDSCWQVQGAPFNSLSPKSLFPVLVAELAVPPAAFSRGPLAQGHGTILALLPCPFQPCSICSGTTSCCSSPEGRWGLLIPADFPLSPLFVQGAPCSPAPISGSWHKLKTNLAPVSVFAANFTSADYFYGLLTKRERVCREPLAGPWKMPNESLWGS